MPTYTAITYCPNRASAEQLGENVEELFDEPIGVGVFEVEDGSGDWEVGCYFEHKPDAVALDLLAAAAGGKPFVVSEVPDIDWVAHVKRELSPVIAGRFFVYGGHDADKVPDDKVTLLIEAAMAFGTGHHGTTKGCLVAFDKLLSAGTVPERVADIGCGTAVLAMAAAKELPDAQIIASDIDQVAVDVAVANCNANDLSLRVSCIEATGFDHPDFKDGGTFDLIFANILKGPLIALAPDMANSLNDGGKAILSGILHDQRDDVIAEYAQNGLKLLDCFEFGDWSTLIVGKIQPNT